MSHQLLDGSSQGWGKGVELVPLGQLPSLCQKHVRGFPWGHLVTLTTRCASNIGTLWFLGSATITNQWGLLYWRWGVGKNHCHTDPIQDTDTDDTNVRDIVYEDDPRVQARLADDVLTWASFEWVWSQGHTTVGELIIYLWHMAKKGLGQFLRHFHQLFTNGCYMLVWVTLPGTSPFSLHCLQIGARLLWVGRPHGYTHFALIASQHHHHARLYSLHGSKCPSLTTDRWSWNASSV